MILHSFLEGDGEPDGDVEADLSSPEEDKMKEKERGMNGGILKIFK